MSVTVSNENFCDARKANHEVYITIQFKDIEGEGKVEYLAVQKYLKK